MSDLIKIMLVEDDPMVCESYRIATRHQPDLSIVYETGSEQQALGFLQAHRIDVVILDIELAEGDGVSFLDSSPGFVDSARHPLPLHWKDRLDGDDAERQTELVWVGGVGGLRVLLAFAARLAAIVLSLVRAVGMGASSACLGCASHRYRHSLSGLRSLRDAVCGHDHAFLWRLRACPVGAESSATGAFRLHGRSRACVFRDAVQHL